MASPDPRGLAVVVSGPSGTGKTTICARLAQQHGYEFSVSATTRDPRPGEKDGLDYRFISEQPFREAVARGEFLEHSGHFGHMYGTPLAPVERALKEGRVILIEIDVNGADQVLNRLPDTLSIFITAPDMGETARRLQGRHSESDAAIRRRMERAGMEIARKIRYDYEIVNDDLETAVSQIHDCIEAEARKRDGRRAT